MNSPKPWLGLVITKRTTTTLWRKYLLSLLGSSFGKCLTFDGQYSQLMNDAWKLSALSANPIYPRYVGRITPGTPRSQRAPVSIWYRISQKAVGILSSVTLPGFLKIHQHTKHSGIMLIWLSVILLSTAGSDVHVVRTNHRLIDKLRRDNNDTPPADLWRRSTMRGHMGVTLHSSTTTCWRRRRLTKYLVYIYLVWRSKW